MTSSCKPLLLQLQESLLQKIQIFTTFDSNAIDSEYQYHRDAIRLRSSRHLIDFLPASYLHGMPEIRFPRV